MSDQFFYTHHIEFKNSSAISDVFYSDRMERLYVVFTNGNVAGYKAVPVGVIDGFKNAVSPGQYYNNWVKNRYSGTHTDVVFVPAQDHKVSHSASRDNLAYAADSVGKNRNNDKVEFVLSVRLDGSFEFRVKATDAKGAIEEVEKILKGSSSGLDASNFTIEGVNRA